MKRAGPLFVVLVLGATLAAGQAADPDAVLAEIVKLRHARENLEQLPAQMQAGVEQSLTRMPPALAEKLRPAFRQGIPEAYKPELLLRGMLNSMKRNYDPERATAFLKALRSPLQQKISTLNSQASAPDFMKKMEEYAAKLAATPPRPERVALLKELDEVGGDAEWAITLNLETIRAQHRVFERFAPEGARMTEEQFEDRLKQMREQMRGPVQNRMRVFLLFAFDSLSDDEVKLWIAHEKSDAGRWFDRVMKQGFLQVMSTASEDLASRIAESSEKRNP